MTKMFSPQYRSPQNPQELTRATMRVYAGGTGSLRVEPGRYGFNSVWTRVEPGRYGFNSVWTRFEIRLFVTVA